MQNIKELIEQKLNDAVLSLGLNLKAELERPKDSSHGDWSSNIGMRLTKELKKSPLDIAGEIVAKIGTIELVDKIEVVKPGFINFYISNSFYKDVVNEIDESFGKSNWGDKKTWLIEHTSANPNKAMHLGHLRNNLTGMAISNIWEFI